jgi:Tol biopolymer transport system component/DNA-binding CsgD family transcriptional regulator
MAQRGRPRHPGLLTPREWEVLALVREGLSNREIGDRLGVSKDGVKYHLAQIYAKLGVSTREEAAAWQPAPGAAASTGRVSRFARVGLFASAGAVVAGLVVLTGAVVYNELSSGDSGNSSEDTVSSAHGGGPPTPSPLASAAIPTPSPYLTPAPPADAQSFGKIAYVRDGNLWAYDFLTDSNTQLVQRSVALTFGTTEEDLTLLHPEWSADGEWIAYGIRNGAVSNATSIWAVRASDALLEGGGYGWYWEWCPTALVLAGGFSGGELSQPVDSYPADYYHGLATGPLINVGQGEARWSPDGKSYAVPDATGPRLNPQVSDDGSAPFHIKIIDPTAAGPTITPTNKAAGMTTVYTSSEGGSAPVLHSWSPDGRYILFWEHPGPKASDGVGIVDEMATVEVATGEVHELGQTRVFPASAAWSPDGSLIALTNQSKAIEIVTPDGEVRNTISDQDSYAGDPVWSPDGTSIAYTKLGAIWIANSDGSGVTQITDRSQNDIYPQWSANGSRITFVRLSNESLYHPVLTTAELWMVGSDGGGAQKLLDLPRIDLSQHKEGVDWSEYFSWYRPHGVAPFIPAPGPSAGPTDGQTPPPAPFKPTPSGGGI